MSRLVVNEEGKNRIVEIDRPVFNIGRGSDNQVIIQDPRSSRKHCRISQTPHGWVLEDLKSRNGTTLNGVQVERHFLKGGDKFHIGKVTLKFEEDTEIPDTGAAGRDVPAKAAEEPGEAEPALEFPDDDPALELPDEIKPVEGPPGRSAEMDASPGQKSADSDADSDAAQTIIESRPLYLEGVEGRHANEKIPITRFPFTIGRGSRNDFTISDPRASGTHARIVQREEYYFLEDLGSRNGTFLNNRKIREARLSRNSILKIGDTTFRVELPPGARDAAPEIVPAENGAQAQVADFSRFNAREFLRETDATATPLTVGAILLLMGTILYFAVDVTLKTVRRIDPDPSPAGNVLVNWSFENRGEGGGIPGWAIDGDGPGAIELTSEGARYPGRKALRLTPGGQVGIHRVIPVPDIPITPGNEYTLAAHVMNQGAFAAGIQVSWRRDSGGRRVEVGRDWGRALIMGVSPEDLNRKLTAPASAVFARVTPYVLAAGEGVGGAIFDRIYFGHDEAGQPPPPAEGGGTGETGGGLPVDVQSGTLEGSAETGRTSTQPIFLRVAADGTIRDLRRGSRAALESMWIGLPVTDDPLALGPRLMTSPRQVSDREGVLLVAQIPDLEKGVWYPLESRINGQGGEIHCEFRIGRGRSENGSVPEKAVFYLEPEMTLKEITAFGGELKSPTPFPPDRPIQESIDELLFGNIREQVAILFSTSVKLRSIEHPEREGRKLLLAEFDLPRDPNSRGRLNSTRMISLRISPFSQKEDESVVALLKEAARCQRDLEPLQARAHLKALRERFPWRTADLNRAAEMEKQWDQEAERALREIESGLEDLRQSPSSVIRNALLSRAETFLKRFGGSPSERTIRNLVDQIKKISPAPRFGQNVIEAGEMLQRSRTYMEQGSYGLADLFLSMARAANLDPEQKQDASHLNELIEERRKRRAAEEIR